MHLQFLTPTQAKLIDVNPRSERRGAHELVPAVDIRLQVDTTPQTLLLLDPELCEFLFKESPQIALPDMEPNPYSSQLRFPELVQPLHWGGEGKGYSLMFNWGICEGGDIQLHECKLSKLTLTVKEGGTVQLTFTVSSCEGVNRQQVGELGTRVQHAIFFTLVCAGAEVAAAS